MENNRDKFINGDFIEEVFKFIEARSMRSRILDDHDRSTYLISKSTLKNLDSVVNYVDILGAVDGKFASERVEDYEHHMKYRMLSKNFKSVAVNMAIDNLVAEFETENGKVPQVEKVRYRAKNGEYNRAYKVVDGENVYFSELNNRGEEVKYYSNTEKSSLYATKEEIEQLYNTRLRVAGELKEDVKEITTRAILDDLADAE